VTPRDALYFLLGVILGASALTTAAVVALLHTETPPRLIDTGRDVVCGASEGGR
jgi:hypothetical protein